MGTEYTEYGEQKDLELEMKNTTMGNREWKIMTWEKQVGEWGNETDSSSPSLSPQWPQSW